MNMNKNYSKVAAFNINHELCELQHHILSFLTTLNNFCTYNILVIVPCTPNGYYSLLVRLMFLKGSVPNIKF